MSLNYCPTASSSRCPPPSYSPSTASPRYAAEPSADEERLDFVAHPQAPPPTGVFTKKTRSLTVSLNHQEHGATIPSYARHAVVSGEVHLEKRDSVQAVTVKLEGRQLLSIAEGGDSSRVLFSFKHELWSKSSCSPCPRIVPFDVPFPTTYETKDGKVCVPPSFDARHRGIPGLQVDISYTLSVTITRPRLGLKCRTTVTIPIQYHPRSRPYLPIPPRMHPFLSTVKHAPGEWFQISSKIESRDDSIAPVDSHLFIPSVLIYSVTDTIPFHLQLRGRPKSLAAFLGIVPELESVSSCAKSISSKSSKSSASSSTEPSVDSLPQLAMKPYAMRNPYLFLGHLPTDLSLVERKTAPTVRVFMLRQVAAKVNKQKAWRNLVIGEATLRPVLQPPAWSAGEPDPDEFLSLDYEGELKCNEDVSVASFAAGDVAVKDFIVIHLCPPQPETSPLIEHQHSHPVRLVTDTYRDVHDHPSDR